MVKVKLITDRIFFIALAAGKNGFLFVTNLVAVKDITRSTDPPYVFSTLLFKLHFPFELMSLSH